VGRRKWIELEIRKAKVEDECYGATCLHSITAWQARMLKRAARGYDEPGRTEGRSRKSFAHAIEARIALSSAEVILSG